MSLAETELTIGGTSFKGVYIAILLSLATTLGGGVWTASSLYGRLESVESRQIPDIAPIQEQLVADKQELLSAIKLIQAELEANDVSQLQGKLSALGVNLATIAEQQTKLLLIDDNVEDLEKAIEAMKGTVTKAELITQSVTKTDAKLKAIQNEINQLWDGMDYLSNPLKQDSTMLQNLIAPIANLAGTFLNNRAEEKQAKHQAKMSVIQSDADWEAKMANASGESWKDEYLIVLLTSPVIAIMYGAMTDNPEIIERVKYGLQTLELLPDWFSYMLGVGVTASFGIKGADKIMKLKGK